MRPGPLPGLGPLSQTPPARHAGTEPEFLRRVFPGDPGMQHEAGCPGTPAGPDAAYVPDAGCRHQRGEPLLGQTCTFEQELAYRMGEVAPCRPFGSTVTSPTPSSWVISVTHVRNERGAVPHCSPSAMAAFRTGHVVRHRPDGRWDHLGPKLALHPRQRFAKDTVLIVDGTLVPTRDHTIAEWSKNYRYSTNTRPSSMPTPGTSSWSVGRSPGTATTARRGWNPAPRPPPARPL